MPFLSSVAATSLPSSDCGPNEFRCVNGLDPEFTDPSLRDCLGQNMKPYLLSVAGAYPHKRLDILLAAFSSIAGERPDLQLVLAGTHAGRPDAVARLRAQADDTGLGSRIRFLPRLPRKEVPRLFACATAFVSASEFEGFGIPVLEAMGAECPVAAAPAEAVIEDGAAGGWPGFQRRNQPQSEAGYAG
jgi:glycosyltransferase involved in cell wall biosynthesis